MFPQLNNLAFLMWLLMLGSMWYLVTIWQAIAEKRHEEEKKKGQRRRLKPRSADDCWC
jgi:hypothetical protein